MTTERVRATYFIETAYEPAEAAEVLAGEQSSGTFVSVPGETDELKRRFRARVEALRPLETVDAPSLPGARVPAGGGPVHRAEVEVSFSLENMGTNQIGRAHV